MSVIVNTNVQSLVAQRNLTKATNALNNSTTRLSTGLKINSASDDAAGMFIAKGLASQISGLEQCQTNIALGVNVLQIAEGDMSTIDENLTRIKDLATQAASGVYSSSARTAMQEEIDARMLEINRVANASNFNGQHLLAETGGMSELRIQVGAGDTENDRISIKGALGNATATGLFKKLDKDGNITSAAIAQIDGTSGQSADLNKVTDVDSATKLITQCEDALNTINEKRSKLGVGQTRLEAANEGLATTIENVSSAKSTIMDTDVAAETSEYTKQQILQQISASVLTQANAAPSIALSLMS